jgi:succinate dehydrogenase / fumarate reductase flavoprotein subunit
MSESARGEGGRVWVPRTPQDSRDPKSIPEKERYYFLEERYPKYGNLVPRDIATREIFDVCVNGGLSVEKDRQCVYLDLTHIDPAELTRKLGGILGIYEKFQGVDPRFVPMKIFPAVHYSMGGLWCGYEAGSDGGLKPASPKYQATNIPNLYAIGECDFQYHGANRLGANSLLSCIFSGLFLAPGLQKLLASPPHGAAADQPKAVFDGAVRKHQEQHDALLHRPKGKENPYLIHQELGRVMTETATVVRYNDKMTAAYGVVSELEERAKKCSLSDTGNWTNQNVVFTKALLDMFPLAKTILKGAIARDECRGAHFKPDFEMPGVEASDPTERRRKAELWCDEFEGRTRKWLKTTIADLHGGEPVLSYEDIDTSSIPPRPRLYGLVGADTIEKVWKERAANRPAASAHAGNGASAASEKAKAL